MTPCAGREGCWPSATAWRWFHRWGLLPGRVSCSHARIGKPSPESAEASGHARRPASRGSRPGIGAGRDGEVAPGRLGTDLFLQGVDHGGRGCARIVSCRRPDGPPEPAGVVVDGDPAPAARHRLGGDAGHQGDPETGGDEPEPRGPVAGGEGYLWLGDAGPCAELRGVAGTGPDDPPLVCELVGVDLVP